MKELGVVLQAFREATRCDSAVWTQPRPDGALVADAVASPTPHRPPADQLPEGLGATRELTTPDGPMLVATVPGPRRAWLTVGPCPPGGTQPLARYVKFLLPVVAQYMQSALEVEHAASELADRYEEINLLYAISDILGRTVNLEEAAPAILTEISETVGARKASILVHDRVTDTLQVVAALGVRPEDAPPIDTSDECSVSARVFRTQHPMIVEPDDMNCPAEQLYRRGTMLSVPILWTTPDGGEPLGVLNLSDRRSGQTFTAGDQKLVAAIATQIATAIQNTRLVRNSLAQSRLVQEMQLAHDLQMKLLPSARIVAPEANVAARVVPAESVGGDFYHLFRLEGERTGVMIGDVSSHGYRAALIMALAMSASAIHARTTSDPAEALNALLVSMRDELNSTEMFITTFYGVIDREIGELRYANAGHPHAFHVTDDGAVERLPALDPPLGMSDSPPAASARRWTSGSDLLLLFTDGISDARNRMGSRLGEQAVLDVVRQHRAESPQSIVDRVFLTLAQHTGDVPLRDDLTLVILRS
ncbi:MAG: PP2C family protein-serine/threonine phosphatase [Gemmatimonadaceae bacterium]